MRARSVVVSIIVLVSGCYESHQGTRPIPPRPSVDSSTPRPEVDSSIPRPPGERCDRASALPLAPRVLFADQGFSTSLLHQASADCGCTAVATRTSSGVSFELCACLDACDDAFTDYVASHVEGPLPVGTHELTLGDTPHTLHVIDTDIPLPGAGCRPIDATSVTVITPGGYTFGPRLTWAVIEGVQPLCCTPPPGPRFAARSTAGVGRVEAELFTCTLEDCFCGSPTPTAGVAVHSLGELAPGDYTLRINGMSVESFNVPPL